MDELRAAVYTDPLGVANTAVQLVAKAREEGDLVALSQSLSLLGRARRSLGQIDLAEADLTEAIAVALAVGENDLAADAHIGQAGVLSFAGRSAEAFAHLDEAERLGSKRTRAYASLQRAIIEQAPGVGLAVTHINGLKFEPDGPVLHGKATVDKTSYAAPYLAALIAEVMGSQGVGPRQAWLAIRQADTACSPVHGGGVAVALTSMQAAVTTPAAPGSVCEC